MSVRQVDESCSKNPEEIQIIIHNLKKQMKKNEMYLLADQKQYNIQILKNEIKLRKKESLKLKHHLQTQQLQRQHNQKLNISNQKWQKLYLQLQNQYEHQQQIMKERHRNELKVLRDQFQKKISSKPKDNSNILNLKKIQTQVAKRKNYKGAYQIQRKISILQKQENLHYLERRANNLSNLIINMTDKHLQELKSLQRKFQKKSYDYRCQKQKQCLKLEHKFDNEKKTQFRKQQIQILKFENSFPKSLRSRNK